MVTQLRVEGKIPIPNNTRDQKVVRAIAMAENLAQKLDTGTYIQRPKPVPTFFVKLQVWSEDLDIEELDIEEKQHLKLSDGTTIMFNEEHVNGDLENKNKFRIVLLAENGMTSYTSY